MAVKVAAGRRSDRFAGRPKHVRFLLVILVGMALLTALLFLSAVLCLRNDAVGMIVPLAAYGSCVVSAFTVGFFAAKTAGKSGLLSGLISASALCLLLLILCLALYGTLGAGYFIASALILFFGMLGGVTALNHRHRRRYR